MSKKNIVYILVTLIVLTFSVPVNAAPTDYSDVETSDWFFGSLSAMSATNVIKGYPDGTFRANDTLTVDQYVTMLCRLTDNDVGVATEGYWAQNYIDYANEQGWFDGMSLYNFQKPINRFETARLSIKAMGLTEDTYPAEYPDYEIYVGDYDSIPALYKDDVLINYALGITRGYPDGTFQGFNTLTRAEGAVISHRIYSDSVRKPPLVPEKTEALMMMFAAMPAPVMPVAEEVIMEGPVMTFPMGGGGGAVPLTDTGLEPDIAVISESILADAILEMSDTDSTNLLGAGYNYGVFNLNLLTADDDSLLLYTTEDGSNVITIDLLQLTDEEGGIPADAVDLLRLICQNIDYDNSEDMLTWILVNYKNRTSIPEDGNDIFFDTTLMGISSLIHDHNVLKVTIQTDVQDTAEGEDTSGGGAFN